MPIPIPMPMSELCDRLTISMLKLKRLTAEEADHVALQQQIDYYNRGIDTTDWQLLQLLAELVEVNGQIWDAEHSIRKGLDDHSPMDEIGRRALVIRDINMRRIAIKNRIAQHTQQAEFTDVKMNYANMCCEGVALPPNQTQDR